MTIFIRQDGMYGTQWNQEKEKWVTLPVQRKLTPYWNDHTEIENASLGNLLFALRRFPEDEIKVLENLSNASIRPFLEEVIRSTVTDNNALPISYLEISKRYEIKDDGPPPYDLVESIIMAGYGEEGVLSVSFSPLRQLKHCPLQISPYVEFYSRKSNVTTGYKASLTFGEVLTAVFDEIGCHGTPEKRDEIMKEIIDGIHELERSRREK